MAENQQPQSQNTEQINYSQELEALISAISDYNPHLDTSLVKRAFEFACSAHKGQKRDSGEDFVTHPIAVTKILAELKVDSATIAAGLLHDVLEDTKVTEPEMTKEFGEEVTTLVKGVTKMEGINFQNKEDYKAENIRKVVLAMSKDVRVILIKLADRLHNMRTLKFKSKETQKEKALETIEIYAPIAYKLGIYKLKSELEDSALKFLNPDVYYDLKSKVSKKRAEREQEVEKIRERIQDLLDKKGIKARVFGRAKHFYSIYKKMLSQKKEFDELYDLLAIRVITTSIDDCYRALGAIHSTWTPIPSQFADHITMPKPNGYQSIHTKIIFDKRSVEVQIRSIEMHHLAEDGIAAHWRYKDTEYDKKFDRKISWLKQILAWKREAKSANEFIESLKIDLFENEIVVLTPKGDPISLPEGSTPVDFAYYLHTEIGNTAQKSKVNGAIVTLDHKLKSGDIVEIMTSKSSTPSRSWLKFVKTSFARTEIRQALEIKGVQKEDEPEIYKLAQEIIVDDPKLKSKLRLSRCCNPKYGEPIQSFLLKDGKVSVHSKRCTNLQPLAGLKKIEVRWPNKSNEILTMYISANDRVGLMAQILNTLAEDNINIKSINTAEKKEQVQIIMHLEAGYDDKMRKLIDKIKKITNVVNVSVIKKQ